MKKHTILFSFLGVAVIVSITGCQKKSETLNTKKPNIYKVGLATNTTQTYDDKSRDCFPPGSNCGSTTTIRPHTFDDLVTANQNGNLGGYFSDLNSTSTDLYPALTQQQLSMLQSGGYSMLQVASGSQNSVYYFLTGPAPTLTLTNYSFVMAVFVSQN